MSKATRRRGACELDGSYATRGIVLDVQAKVDAAEEGTAVYLTFRSADGCSEHREWHDHEGRDHARGVPRRHRIAPRGSRLRLGQVPDPAGRQGRLLGVPGHPLPDV